MAHGYRTLQRWNDWLAHQPLGISLLAAEEQMFSSFLQTYYGKHVLLIGVPQQYSLMSSTLLQRQTLVSPLIDKQHNLNYIETTFHDLPILTGSVDMVMIPHTLELIEHPRQLLAEACRIIKPEGMIVISGFNPYSLWGVRRYFSRDHHAVPWSNHFMHTQKIKNWLRLADFAIESQSATFYRPPMSSPQAFDKLKFLESVGRVCLPACGGIYMIIARAKVIPLTPIKMKWKQQLGEIRIPQTISGHIVRSSK